jgi:hypothetical protein
MTTEKQITANQKVAKKKVRVYEIKRRVVLRFPNPMVSRSRTEAISKRSTKAYRGQEAMSVWAKSPPLDSSGSPDSFASA